MTQTCEFTLSAHIGKLDRLGINVSVIAVVQGCALVMLGSVSLDSLSHCFDLAEVKAEVVIELGSRLGSS